MHQTRKIKWSPMLMSLCGVLVWVMALASPAIAQTDEPIISDRQLEQLNDPEYEARETATRELLQDKRLKLDAVVEAYRRAATPEARHRLLNIARHCLVREQMAQNPVNGDQGAIGVRPAGVLPRQLAHCKEPAVIVVSTSVGFPGNAYLQANDLITQVNGRPLRPSDNVDAIRDEFIKMIETMKPDQMIDLTVNRDGKVQHVRFALANKVHLQNFYTNPAVGTMPVRLISPWVQIRRHIEQAGEQPEALNFRLPNARLDEGRPRQPTKVDADLLSKAEAARRAVEQDGAIRIRVRGDEAALEVTQQLLRQLDAEDPNSPNGKRVRALLETIQGQMVDAPPQEQAPEQGEAPQD